MDTIVEWVSAGALAVWGKVGETTPPHLVLPLTVEPTKPRLCHDERYLNLWIKDVPFSLDHLTDLPRYVLPGHFQTCFDDKNGYQHVLLHSLSSTYFGLKFKGVYFVFRALPFGWKASAFIYHKLGLAVSDAARSLGVPVSQYIDDRHVGQLFRPEDIVDGLTASNTLSEASAYIMCYLLIEAGYFIGLGKSQSTRSTVVRFLGFMCDASRQAFLIPEDKRQKFETLKENILASRVIDLKTLQRFSGKVLSFSLAIPGCKLYAREVFEAISRLSRSSKPVTRVVGSLRDEVAHWRFLDTWTDCLRWRSERHLSVSYFSDAAQRAWGATLHHEGNTFQCGDYWPSGPRRQHQLVGGSSPLERSCGI